MRAAGTESSRSKMQTSAPEVTAFRSRAASVPGVKSALRTRRRGLVMAECAALSECVDLAGGISGLCQDGVAVAVECWSRPVGGRVSAHLDGETDGRHLTQ